MEEVEERYILLALVLDIYIHWLSPIMQELGNLRVYVLKRVEEGGMGYVFFVNEAAVLNAKMDGDWEGLRCRSIFPTVIHLFVLGREDGMLIGGCF